MEGFSFLEVLVSLFILSLMLWGLDVMQVNAFRDQRAAYDFMVASNQMNNMVERLSLFDPLQDATSTIDLWNTENKEALPQGRGQMTGEYPDYKIVLSWGNTVSSCSFVNLGLSGCIQQEVLL